MATKTAPAPSAPATPATPAPAAESVNGKPAVLPTPGTELGVLNDGVTVKASGVDPKQPATATNFKDAGKAFLATVLSGERTVAEEATARAQVDNEVTRLEQRPAATTGSEGAESEDEMEEEGAAQPDGELWLDEATGKWRDKSGKFVQAEPPTDEELAAAGITREQLAQRQQQPAPTKGKNENASGQPVAIKLAGAPERGEDDIEIEIDDPDVASRLQRLQNEGMRRQAYNEAMADVESQRAELQAIGQALELDPVGFAINHMTRERQLEVAEALLVEHFDALVDRINQFADDPVTRERGRVELRDRLSDSRDQLADSRARQSHAAACMRTAEGLAPEGVDDATLRLFLADAENDLIRAAKAGRPVTPETVPQILARRAHLYGFGENAEPAGGAASGAPASRRPASNGSARPLTDRARAIADKKREASEAQKRIRRVQVQRRGAAAVAPTGIGAATLSVPVLSDDDMKDVRAASKALRRMNLSNTSWEPAGAR